MHNIYYEILDNVGTVQGISNCIIKAYYANGHEYDTTPHWHDGFEMTLILKGSIRHTCREHQYFTEEGDLLFIDSGAIHSTINASESKLCSLVTVISDEFLKEHLPDIQNLSFAITKGTPAYEKIRDYMYDIFHLLTKEDPCCIHLLIKAKLLNIIYVMYTECRADKPFHPHNEFHSKKVMQYINEHYTEAITLDTAAQIAGLQKNYFSRCFKKQTGLSFKHYLNKIRLDAALSLLAEASFSMLDCALQAGFSGEKIMIDWCKKIYHTTPCQYLKLQNAIEHDASNYKLIEGDHERQTDN